MTLFTVRAFAERNVKLNQWPQSENRIWYFRRECLRAEIEGGFVTVGGRILIDEEGFYKAISQLPAKTAKFKKKDLPDEAVSESPNINIKFLREKEHTVKFLKEAEKNFATSLEQSESVEDMRIPIVEYLWRYIIFMGGLITKHSENSTKK